MEKSNVKVNVLDSVMGSGKSTNIRNKIKDVLQKNPMQKILIIVPYQSEVETYKKDLKEYGFFAVTEGIKYKKGFLEKLLINEENIICTHALFLIHNKLIQEYASDYTLIIDEVIDSVIEEVELPQYIMEQTSNGKKEKIKSKLIEYSFSSKDIDLMIDIGVLLKTEDNILKWTDDCPQDIIYSILEGFFKSGDIHLIENKNYKNTDTKYSYIRVLPIEAFNCFEEIFILTYLWYAEKMSYYFAMNNIECNCSNWIRIYGHGKGFYSMTTLTENALGSVLCEIPEKGEIKKLITMPDNEKLYSYINLNGKKKNLSYNFYINEISKEENQIILKQIKSNVKNVIENYFDISAKDRKIMWTIYTDNEELILDKPKCRHLNKKNFVTFNTKGTNDFRDRNIAIYLIDRYMRPVLKKFIDSKCSDIGLTYNEEQYSLSQLIQWVWRSQIRDGKPICLYIASGRMAKIFSAWLEEI